MDVSMTLCGVQKGTFSSSSSSSSSNASSVPCGVRWAARRTRPRRRWRGGWWCGASQEDWKIGVFISLGIPNSFCCSAVVSGSAEEEEYEEEEQEAVEASFPTRPFSSAYHGGEGRAASHVAVNFFVVVCRLERCRFFFFLGWGGGGGGGGALPMDPSCAMGVVWPAASSPLPAVLVVVVEDDVDEDVGGSPSPCGASPTVGLRSAAFPMPTKNEGGDTAAGGPRWGGAAADGVGAIAVAVPRGMGCRKVWDGLGNMVSVVERTEGGAAEGMVLVILDACRRRSFFSFSTFPPFFSFPEFPLPPLFFFFFFVVVSSSFSFSFSSSSPSVFVVFVSLVPTPDSGKDAVGQKAGMRRVLGCTPRDESSSSSSSFASFWVWSATAAGGGGFCCSRHVGVSILIAEGGKMNVEGTSRGLHSSATLILYTERCSESAPFPSLCWTSDARSTSCKRESSGGGGGRSALPSPSAPCGEEEAEAPTRIEGGESDASWRCCSILE